MVKINLNLSYHPIYVFAKKKFHSLAMMRKKANLCFQNLKSLTSPCSFQPTILNSACTCSLFCVQLVTEIFTNQVLILLLSKVVKVEATSKPRVKTWSLYSSSSLDEKNLEFMLFITYFLTFLKTLLLLERGEGREEDGEEEKQQCARETSIGCLLHTPNWGPGLQPRYVP